MAENKHLVNSINHALMLTAAGTTAVFFWMFLRLPHSNIMVVTGAFLLTGVLYDAASWKHRLHMTITALFNAAMLQFLLGVSHSEKFLEILLPSAYIFFMLSMIQNKAISSSALIIGTLGLAAPPGFYPSFTCCIDFLFSGISVMIVTSLLSLIRYNEQEKTEIPEAYTKIQSLRIALIYGIGIYLNRVLHFPQGLWIVFCIAMVYAGISPERNAFKTAEARIFSTPLGIVFCFLYLACFAYFDYRMTYLIPLIGGFGFFLLYYKKNYFAFTALFLMTFSIYADIASGDVKRVHFMQLLCSRSLASVIGIFLLMIYEKYFLPDKENA